MLPLVLHFIGSRLTNCVEYRVNLPFTVAIETKIPTFAVPIKTARWIRMGLGNKQLKHK